MNTLYVTIVSYEYALMGLSIGRALQKQGKQSAIYCMDEKVAELLATANIQNCFIFPPSAYMTNALSDIRKERKDSEFCWTCKSVILTHALQKFPELDWAIYLDSDMMIYGDPDSGLPENENSNVVLTPHSPSTSHFESFIEKAGEYNAGYIAFRNSTEGCRALSWWRDRCLESCSVNADGEVYADQRYLNLMPELFSGVYISGHAGLNAAPWNILGKSINSSGEAIFINQDQLLAYHMQGFKIVSREIFDLYCGEQRLPKEVRETIYLPYVCHLVETSEIMPKTYYSKRAISIRSRIKSFFREIKRLMQGVSNICFYRFIRC